MATEQERKDKVKAEDLQKAVIVALQTVEDVRPHRRSFAPYWVGTRSYL